MPERTATSSEVWAQLRAVVEVNEHNGDLRERLGLGIGAGRIKALLLLKDGPLSQAALAAAHNVNAPYATIIVDKLEALGFVERTLDPTDKRRKIVTLTIAGHSAVAIAEEAIAAPPPVLDTLTHDELATLHSLLTRLTTADS